MINFRAVLDGIEWIGKNALTRVLVMRFVGYISMANTFSYCFTIADRGEWL